MVDSAREQDILRRTVLGWGLACEPIFPGLDLGRDIRLTEGPNGRDFAIVEGMENLAQDLSIELTTLLGSDIFNIQFGFDGLNALVEETDPIMVRERVRVAIVQVLRRDPRIRRIVDVKLLDHRLDMSPLPGDEPAENEPAVVDRRRLNVRVGFETIVGDQVNLDLGKVIPDG